MQEGYCVSPGGYFILNKTLSLLAIAMGDRAGFSFYAARFFVCDHIL